MASKVVRPRKGFTRYSNERGAAMPSGIILQDTAGNDWYFWVATDGDLRVAEAATVEASNFNPASSGAVVGGQS